MPIGPTKNDNFGTNIGIWQPFGGHFSYYGGDHHLGTGDYFNL